MSLTETARPARIIATPIPATSAGHTGTLNGHIVADPQTEAAVEGEDSPQATREPTPISYAPAGIRTAQPPMVPSSSRADAVAGHTNGRGQASCDAHSKSVPAPDFPGVHGTPDAHPVPGTGDQAPPVLMTIPVPKAGAVLADPLLALAADVLGDLEKVRIANENRLRQLTRSQEDSDGETRGFGLDESHPDVARLAALVDMLGDAEHKATLNLGRLMRKHPLGPWLAAQKGIGEKQGARLLAAIGDPYIRPEIVREDGSVEPSRPRLVSELWAFCGYHVLRVPASGQEWVDAQHNHAADGPSIPADHMLTDTQSQGVGGKQNGHPGHADVDAHVASAGVAPKRARGQKANWSSAAKMRAFLVAESCIKQSGTPYRAKYDTTREKYADAIHLTECVRCGPKGKPAQPGTPLSAGHQHARALRAVAKEVLRDLWREAKRLHEEAAQGG